MEEQLPEQDAPFQEQLVAYLKLGMDPNWRPGSNKRSSWTNDLVAEQTHVTTRSVTNWRNGSRTPTDKEFKAIEQMLFGASPWHDVRRQAFRAAWEIAKQNRGRPGRGPQKPPETNKRGGSAPLRNEDLDWVPVYAKPLREDLAKMSFSPSSTDPATKQAPLDATVSIGNIDLTIDRTDHPLPLQVVVGIRKASIVTVKGEDQVQIDPNTILGGKKIKHDCVKYESSWLLTVPRDEHGRPGGIVLAYDTLCQVQALPGAKAPAIHLELRCGEFDLDVDYPERPKDVTEAHLALVRRLIQQHLEPLDPRTQQLTLARGGLRKRRPS